jgi:hypothetical protein
VAERSEANLTYSLFITAPQASHWRVAGRVTMHRGPVPRRGVRLEVALLEHLHLSPPPVAPALLLLQDLAVVDFVLIDEAREVR